MFMFGNKTLFLSMLLAGLAIMTTSSQARAQDAFTDFILEQEERLKETAAPTIATIHSFVADLKNSYKSVTAEDFDYESNLKVTKDSVDLHLNDKHFIGLGFNAEDNFTTHDNSYSYDMRGADDKTYSVNIRTGFRF